MRVFSSQQFRQASPWRSLVGFGGVAAGSIAVTIVIVLFGQASSMPWLADTSANAAALRHCGAAAGSAAHRACVEGVVVAMPARDAEVLVATARPTPAR